jgi:ADP-heptose:LPS heptosyltransferase
VALAGGTGTVLVLRALGLGDALTGVPALRGVRRAHPGARIVLAAPPAVGGWLRDLGIVDEVVPCRGPELHWDGPPPDVAVNLHGRGPQSHRSLLRLGPGRLVAFACPEAGHDDGPPWPAAAHEVDRWCGLVVAAGGDCGRDDLHLPPPPRRDHVVLHPGAASGSRRWPVERWRALAGHLLRRGRKVVVTGSGSERALCAAVAEHPAVVDTSGTLDLHGLADLVGSASLLVCGDTGVAHLATATGTPSVLLFGPTAPRHWGPVVDLERHLVLWRSRRGDPPGDPHADTVDPRLDRLQVDDVVRAVDRLERSLSRPRARRS